MEEWCVIDRYRAYDTTLAYQDTRLLRILVILPAMLHDLLTLRVYLLSVRSCSHSVKKVQALRPDATSRQIRTSWKVQS